MNRLTQPFDVLVVGGGNAGLCAAITARRGGARVLVLESAIKDFRGGNSRHTRDIRYMHRAATDYVTGAYTEQEFWEDLRQVTGGETNEGLARLTIQNSEELGNWMPASGVRWQKPLRGTLHLAKSNLFMLGGGKAMMNAYYDTALRSGVQIAYESEVSELKIRDGEFLSAVVSGNGASREVEAKAIVVACRRIRSQHPMAEGVLGKCCRQLHHPRHETQPGANAKRVAPTRRKARRRSPWLPRRRARRARAQVRRRYRHAP